MKKNSWTDDDICKMRDYAERGRSAYRIAAALNRTVPAVRSQAQRSGIIIQSGTAIRGRQFEREQLVVR